MTPMDPTLRKQWESEHPPIPRDSAWQPEPDCLVTVPDRAWDRAMADAGYMPLPDYVERYSQPVAVEARHEKPSDFLFGALICVGVFGSVAWLVLAR